MPLFWQPVAWRVWGLPIVICHELDTHISLPAVGQGALAIECRSDDADVLALLKPLNDEQAVYAWWQNAPWIVICRVVAAPIAGFATIQEGQIYLQGRVGSVDGKTLLKAEHHNVVDDARESQQIAEIWGVVVAEALIAQSGQKIWRRFIKTADIVNSLPMQFINTRPDQRAKAISSILRQHGVTVIDCRCWRW